MLRRLPNWPSLLDAYIDSQRQTPFEWGVHDCCLFAANCIQAITGIDVAPKWRKAYQSKDAAIHLANIFSQGGIKQVIKDIAEVHHCVSIAPMLAQRGDIIMFPGEHVGVTLGVVLDQRLVAPGTKGLEFLPIAKVWHPSTTKAWKIG